MSLVSLVCSVLLSPVLLEALFAKIKQNYSILIEIIIPKQFLSTHVRTNVQFILLGRQFAQIFKILTVKGGWAHEYLGIVR